MAGLLLNSLADSDGLASADITVGIYGRIYISGNGRGFLYSN